MLIIRKLEVEVLNWLSMDKYTNDFDLIWNLINTEVNVTFSRYADGEVMLMQGNLVGPETQASRIDKWNSPGGNTKVGTDLLVTLNHEESDYYYAISGMSDDVNDHKYLKSLIKQKESNITFVNLWINANYTKMKEQFSQLKRKVVLIANENAKGKQFPFPVSHFTGFPDNCIVFWEQFGDEYINFLIDNYGKMENQLFFISCGPISEIIIHKLYENNPNNSYIDVGSSIDEYVHGGMTRPYMNPSSRYANEKSYF
jgi:hypothetical protein